MDTHTPIYSDIIPSHQEYLLPRVLTEDKSYVLVLCPLAGRAKMSITLKKGQETKLETGLMTETRESLLRRRVIHLEDLVKEIMIWLKIVEKGNEIMKANTEVLMKNYDDLKNKVCASEKKMEDNEGQVKKISEKQNRWKMDQDQQKVSFKKIIEESAKEREQEVA
ncbi:hypothetical protein E2C01_015818 [Portunus trituberculatus]|uniref:Uncharacterized protein n=1 Tax=Portunus trituberculatus TaxID=210409 RepID=A0A5B7DMI1_PORTR|nr:hypothetical protein [Portunus trituberculatus]